MVSLELEARLDNLLSTAQKETANIDLFRPTVLKEECPICMIPLPINEREIRFQVCCGKYICIGCCYKHALTNKKNDLPRNKWKCAFCCQPRPKNIIKALKKLVKMNEPKAFMILAYEYKSGQRTLQSYTRALEMMISAAELGHNNAYGMIATFYEDGTGIEQDLSKAQAFYEVAAKKGSAQAHDSLASFNERLVRFHAEIGNTDECIQHLRVVAGAGDKEANTDECIQHLRVAAGAGHQQSMDNLMTKYKQKLLTKEDLTQTLRTYQASSNEMKSKDRDDARAFFAEHPM